MNIPKYKVIADYINNKLASLEWTEGHQVPSETELASQFSASRMTARKSVDSLVSKGLLRRVPSVGTFVSYIQAQSSFLEIKNISDEIKSRGHKHNMVVLSKMIMEPTSDQIFPLDSENKKIFKVVIIHYENEIPIQLEERYVRASKAPLFMEQDFSTITVNEYLSSIAPLTEADISIEAIIPSQILKHNLKISDSVACLKVTRSTISHGEQVSYVNLYHPGDKFKFTGKVRVDKL